MSPIAAARTIVFDERWRFDTFVACAATRDAAEAARLVAEAPGARWNPLVIRGGAGLGKSHLLGAIARRAREQRPSLRVSARSAQAPESVHASPVACDLLLVDDVRPGLGPDLAASLRALVDAAVAAGAQVVLAEDGGAPTRTEAGEWVARFPRARLVRVGPPDGDARRAIVANTAAARALGLSADALGALAADPVSNVRELLGRLTRAGASGGTLGTAAASVDADFASFLDEVAREVAAQVDPWRLRLGEAAARWRAEGIDVEVIERALRLPTAPDVDALLATFESAVARLRRLAATAAAHDAALARHAAFRDPARMADAEALARRAAAVRPAPKLVVDAETWVLDWPDVRDLLVEEWR